MNFYEFELDIDYQILSLLGYALNPIIHYDIEQGTDEWHTIRLGKITGSEFKRAISKGEGRKSLLMKLLAEISGEVDASFTSDAMLHGIETESEAISYYELRNDVSVNKVGFVQKTTHIGMSPDGFVGDDGVIEIKCGMLKTHYKWVYDDKVPSEHLPQVLGALWVTGREWCDFISYNPKCSQPKDLFVKRVWAKDYRKEIEEIGVKLLELEADIVDLIDFFNIRRTECVI